MSLGFLIKEGLTGLKRAKFPSFAAVLTIAISLTLLGMSYLIGNELYSLLSNMRAKVNIEVFLLPSATEIDRATIAESLDSHEAVAAYEFISKEEAAARFQEEFGEDIYAVLGENPLPVSYTVDLTSAHRTSDAVSAFVQELRRLPGVDEVRYRQTFLRLLERYYKAALVAGGVILAVILGAAILLVANTIKLSIFAKREIIRIMRLVGATDLFIQTPFIVEGIVHGILGAGLALVLLSGIISGTNYLFVGIVETDIQMGYPLLVGVLITGTLFGLIGSTRSIRMFLSNGRM
ncbi:MAG TPA: ABC transporter permease [bacterium]|nr:ABC transporter permease [bacterium]